MQFGRSEASEPAGHDPLPPHPSLPVSLEQPAWWRGGQAPSPGHQDQQAGSGQGHRSGGVAGIYADFITEIYRKYTAHCWADDQAAELLQQQGQAANQQGGQVGIYVNINV